MNTTTFTSWMCVLEAISPKRPLYPERRYNGRAYITREYFASDADFEAAKRATELDLHRRFAEQSNLHRIDGVTSITFTWKLMPWSPMDVTRMDRPDDDATTTDERRREEGEDATGKA